MTNFSYKKSWTVLARCNSAIFSFKDISRTYLPRLHVFLFVFLGYLNSSWLPSNFWTALILFSLSFVSWKYGLCQCFFQPLLATRNIFLNFESVFIFVSGNCSLSAWTSFFIHRIIFLKSFQKCRRELYPNF